MLGDTERLEDLTGPLVEVLGRRQEIWLLQWTLLESAFTPTAHGDWSEGARRLDEALAISERIGDCFSRGLILDARCWLERSRGDYARALRVGRESVDITSEGSSDVWLGWTAGTLAAAFGDLRAWPEALELLETALAAADRIGARAQRFGALGRLAWVRLQAGDAPGATAAAERWDAMLDQVRAPDGQAHLYQRQSYTDRARVALALGDVARAEEIVHPIREPLERFGIREGIAVVHLVLGACAEARGDLGAAEELLDRGLAATHDEGLPAARLALRMALARVSGSPTHAAAARDLGDTMTESVGDEALAARFRSAVLAELGAPAHLAAE